MTDDRQRGPAVEQGHTAGARAAAKHCVTVPPLAAHSAPVTFDFVDLTKHFARVQVVITSDGLTPAEAELSKQNSKE